jgi:hypothetical protein
MSRLLIAIVSLAAITTAAASAPGPKRAESRPVPRQLVQEQDEFRSCDVSVREFIYGRKEAAALPVKEVKADGLRMTLNFVHPYGESGDTPPNLVFTRGESIEERRKALNETKQRVRMLADAARTGNVWYVIVINKDTPERSEARQSPASMQPNESRSSASAAVFANMDNRCVSVQEYKAISLDTLSRELRALLGDQEQQLPQANDTAAAPPS